MIPVIWVLAGYTLFATDGSGAQVSILASQFAVQPVAEAAPVLL